MMFRLLIDKRWSALLAVGLLAACTSTTKLPDLARLYGATVGLEDQPPVILIHGILGARLERETTGEEAWPGPIRKLLFSDYEDVAMDIDPVTLEPVPDELRASDIFDQIGGNDFYGNIINVLEVAGGYTRASPGQPNTDNQRRIYVFAYDWRQDNVRNAVRLDELIDQIRTDYGRPDLLVDIVAHSMGGLLTRYYLRYGTQDVLDDNEFPVNLWGDGRVRRVILLGTPNLGSLNSVRAFIEGYKLGFGSIRTEILATMPSIYQLFPHPIAGDWLIDYQGRQVDQDLFSADVWRQYQWSIYDPEVQKRIRDSFESAEASDEYLTVLDQYFEKHIERARRFVWSLTVPLEETPWQLILFGGDCELTTARLLVEDINGVSILRTQPDRISRPVAGVEYDYLMLEPGDGQVTKSSLLARNSLDPSVPRHEYIFFPLDYSVFICESHDKLTSNITFQDNLLQVLLSN